MLIRMSSSFIFDLFDFVETFVSREKKLLEATVSLTGIDKMRTLIEIVLCFACVYSIQAQFGES